ncbi:MAG: DUF1800 domain-containing protein [Thermogutta sp.]|nr:DUF1800 domain-containing protein [Thermogutta sp.]
MSRRDVAHLLRRVAANPTAEELDGFSGQLPDAVFLLLTEESPRYHEFEAELRPLEEAAVRSNAANAYRTWFMWRLVLSPCPLREWMTVFWLEYFGLGIERVADLALFDDVVRSMRRLALGDYHELPAAVLLHPAFLLNVRAPLNYRSDPSEQVGAAILRTCLGYREQDFSAQAGELARAFSGRFINRGRLRVSEFERDTGEKTILGRSKAFEAEDIPRLIAEDARAASWTARRLYRWFCCDTRMPSEEFLSPPAEQLRQNGSVAAAVRLILSSQWFFSEAVRRQKLRRPVEFAAALLRALKGRITLRTVTELTAMGQDILQPTTLDGWSEAGNYFSPLALIQRMNLAAKLVGTDENFGGGLARGAVETWGDDLPNALTDLMTDQAIPVEIGSRWEDLRARYAASSGDRERVAAAMIYLLAVSPVFQTA